MNGLLPNLGGYPQNPKRPCFQQYHQIEGMRWLWFDQCSLIASAARCWGRLNWRVGSCLSDLHNGSRSVGASVIHGGITELLNPPVINGIVKFWIISLIGTCSRISANQQWKKQHSGTSTAISNTYYDTQFVLGSFPFEHQHWDWQSDTSMLTEASVKLIESGQPKVIMDPQKDKEVTAFIDPPRGTM